MYYITLFHPAQVPEKKMQSLQKILHFLIICYIKLLPVSRRVIPLQRAKRMNISVIRKTNEFGFTVFWLMPALLFCIC